MKYKTPMQFVTIDKRSKVFSQRNKEACTTIFSPNKEVVYILKTNGEIIRYKRFSSAPLQEPN